MRPEIGHVHSSYVSYSTVCPADVGRLKDGFRFAVRCPNRPQIAGTGEYGPTCRGRSDGMAVVEANENLFVIGTSHSTVNDVDQVLIMFGLFGINDAG